MEKKNGGETYASMGMVIGMCLGVAVGSALGRVDIGMPVGMCLGLAVGSAFEKDGKDRGNGAENDR